MCGIAGVIDLSGKPVEREMLHRMDTVIAHRGPDGHGEYLQGAVGLANRRLAIIDTSSRGKQPMGTKDRKIWITFNGEIFNYRELYSTLQKKGYKFFSHTDTEVILLGYQQWGDQVVEKLSGQFAFCIWDEEKQRALLARDQVGINPLFYTRVGDLFLFCSELKGLLASGVVKKEIDPVALHHYLSMFTVPAPWSMIKQVKQLVPGHRLIIENQHVHDQRYWELPRNFTHQSASLEECKQKLRQTLLSSVKSATVADVPVAAFLSGGIDSSSLVALMATQTKAKIKTFSLWSPGGDAFDERPYALEVAQRYGTDHRECAIDEQTLPEEMPKIVRAFDQPTGGSFETYFISKFVGKEAKVATAGIGGDELFGGYHQIIYQLALPARMYQYLPRAFRAGFPPLIEQLPVNPELKRTMTVLHRILGATSDVQKRLVLYFAYHEEEKKRLYTTAFRMSVGTADTNAYFEAIAKQVTGGTSLDQLAYVDLSTYTRDDLLLGATMTGMANSLEIRVPFLTLDLIELAATIPASFKYRRGVSKYILKEVMKEWLPPSVISHKKTGFGVPRISYMQGVLRPMILSVLDEASVKRRGIFDPKEVERVVNGVMNAKGKMLWNEHLRVWTLFILELWMREYIDV